MNIENSLNFNLTNLTNFLCFAYRLPSHEYRRVYCMVRHEKQRPTYSFLEYAFMSTFLVKFLDANHYFDSDITTKTEDLNDNDKNFIGGLILRNLQILQFNSHEVFDLLKSNKTGARQTVAIGAALYTTLAFFNHSCNPSIVRWVASSFFSYFYFFRLLLLSLETGTSKTQRCMWLPFEI